MNGTEDTQPKNVLEALAFCKRSFIAVGVFSGVANLLMLVPAFFMLNVYDKAVANNSLSTLAVLSIITFVMFLALACMEVVRSKILVAISSRLDTLLGDGLYERAFNNAVRVGDNAGSTLPLQDLAAIRQLLTGQSIFAVFDSPWLPVYLTVLFLFHPILGWMGCFAAAILLLIAVVNQKSTRSSAAALSALTTETVTDTALNLRNAEVVAAMGMTAELKRRWREQQDNLVAVQEKFYSTVALATGLTKTFRLAVQSAAIAAGAYLVLIQEISPGMIIAGSILIGRALQPVELAVGAWKNFFDAREQYDRLNMIMQHFPLDVSPMRLPPIRGDVKVNQAVINAPSSSQPIIRMASVHFKEGETALILGPSGAGKSTLIKGLLGLWPTLSGDIRIDGAEAAQFDRTELGPQLGYLPQAIELLQGTVSANIARFGEIEPDMVIQAANDAGVHEFILSLPNGYDTELGKPGGMLSPGQRQRVALARALYKRPKLVILDEPNSNLDEIGEQALNKAILALKQQGSTVILVSHRKGVLPLVDQLVVLNQGVVVNAGPPAEILALGQPSEASEQEKASPAEASKALPVTTVTFPTGS